MSGLIRQSIGRRKAYLIQLINQANDIREKCGSIDASDKALVESQINELLVKLQKSIEGLEKSDSQWIDLVANLMDPSAEEQQYATTAAADDGYLAVLDEGNEMIGLLQLQVKQLTQNSTTASTNKDVGFSSAPRPPTSNTASIKLPKLKMPLFDGDFYQWKQFWTIFCAAIHNTDFSGVQKFSYLRSYLRGTALDCVSGLELTDDNYELAVELLTSRFERTPSHLIGGLYSKLKRLHTSGNNISQLRKTFDTITTILRQLQNFGEDINSNRSLVLDILSKYPSAVLKELHRQYRVGTHSEVKAIQSVLERYLEDSHTLYELFDDLDPFTTESDRKTARNSHRNDARFTGNTYKFSGTPEQPHSTDHTSAFTASETSAKPNPETPCYFCGGSHFNSQCPNYITAEQRQKRLQQLNRCGKCLRFNHTADTCRTNTQKFQCFFCREAGSHLSPLCPQKFSSGSHAENNKDATVSEGVTNNSKDTLSKRPLPDACSLSVEEHSVLSTAVAFIINPTTGEKHEARIILDNGSHRSYMTERLAHQLKLKSQQQSLLTVSVFGTDRSLSVPAHEVEFNVELRNGDSKHIVAHTTSIITKCELSPISLPQSTRDLIGSMSYVLADDFESVKGAPDVLIGSDYFWEFLSSSSKIQTDDGIYLIPTTLGLVLGGRYQAPSSAEKKETSMLCLTERTNTAPWSHLNAITTESKKGECHVDIDEYWNLESIGIGDPPVRSDDDVAMDQFNNSIRFDKQRYHVSWPWKSQPCYLPTNYHLALGRLRSMLKRIASSLEIYKEYNNLISEQLRLGIIEEVPMDEYFTSTNTIHYLPHHPVVRLSHNTTKLRIVYDASAKSGKGTVSLNECLFRGPVILPELCAILVRFRLYKIALISDIEKAFLQLCLDASQRDVTRFLWLKNPDSINTENNLRIFRFARVPFGIISSPFLLSATLQHHLSKFRSNLAIQIKNNIYVDNVLIGTNDEAFAINSYRESKAIFAQASMNIREWCSNSDAVFNCIPERDRVPNRTVKVLGMQWDSLKDTLSFAISWDRYSNCNTKREVLQAVASVYDPLGLLQPCTLRAKCFLRNIWDANLDWDQPLTDDLKSEWLLVHGEIQPVFSLQIPRRIAHDEIGQSSTLVVFSDASADAYAAAVYLRFRSAYDNTWKSNLVYAKSRLAPRSKATVEISIPRLELLGATIGIRAAIFVRNALLDNSIRIILFTDSTTVLHWIASDRIQPKFVENRVKELRNAVDTSFCYVKSEDNPADVCTRGLCGSEMKGKTLWWHGPDWMSKDQSLWPTKSDAPEISSQDFSQFRGIPHPYFIHFWLGSPQRSPKNYTPVD